MQSIVYLEGTNAWLCDGETLTPCDHSAIKKIPSGASLPLAKLQVGNFKFSSRLNPQELEIQTEIKMYDEGGLDSSAEYAISSYYHTLEFQDSTLVESFAISEDDLNQHCETMLQNTQVIDWAIPSFIAYAAYYPYHEVKPSTDLFYYIGMHESYAVLFHDGKYIAHRRSMSIEEVAIELNMDPEACSELLHEKGLLEANYTGSDAEYFEQLQFIFSKQIEKLVHTINHKRGLFGIEGIERVFVDFAGAKMEGLDALFSAYGMESVKVEAMACKDVEHSHRFIQALYVHGCANGLIELPLNLSLFERKPVWYKRPSGQFISIAAAALLVSLLHPGYFYVKAHQWDEGISEAQKAVKKMQDDTIRLSKKVKVLQDQQSELKSQTEKIQTDNGVYQTTLQTLPVLKEGRYIRQKMMNDSVQLLGNYQLSALTLEQNGTKSMQIHVIADEKKRNNIARFMEAWMAQGYHSARTNEVYLDKHVYESKIEVIR